MGEDSAAWGEGKISSVRSEDLQELWQERVAIMAYEGHLPRAEAERLAWAGLHAQRTAP